MLRAPSLNTRLMIILGVFVGLLLGVVGLTAWMTSAARADAAVINIAGRQRMLSQKLTKATMAYVIESIEQDAARNLVDMLTAVRMHLTSAIDAAVGAGAFELRPEMMGFVPAAASLMIGNAFSEGKAIRVRHVSSNYVNDANRPDEYEARVLAQMEADPRGWKDRDLMERTLVGDGGVMRYMRPMFVSEGCLTCHGDPDRVPQFLRDAYGERLATGYSAGDVRGAISVAWPTRNTALETHVNEANAARALFGQSLTALRDGGETPLGQGTVHVPGCADEASLAALRAVTDLWGRFQAAIDAVFAAKRASDPSFVAGVNTILALNGDLLKRMDDAVTGIQAASEQRTALLQRVQFCAIAAAGAAFAAVCWYVRARVTGPIARIIASLRDGAAQVQDASGQVASAATSVAEGASTQAASLREAEESVSTLQQRTQSNADASQRLRELMGSATHALNDAETAMTEGAGAINRIAESSQKIRGVIRVVQDIAFQTNLLALNAAVEAARAGEAGRGFAVVAEEVRALARRASEATSGIEALIQESSTRVREGVERNDAAHRSFTSVHKATEEAAGHASEIAGASTEQAQRAVQLSKMVSDIDRVTQSTAAAAEQSAAASEQMSAQAVSVATVVDELAAIVLGGSRPAAGGRTAR